MAKLFLTITLLFFGFQTLEAQSDSSNVSIPENANQISNSKKLKANFKDRIFLGGNLGLQFGTQTYIDVSPLIGYKITDRFSSGIGVTYIYYRYKDNVYSYNTNIYGGRVFSRYFFTENIFGHAEFEVLNMELLSTNNYQYYRKNIYTPMIGAGYIQRFSNQSGIYLLLLYNLNDSAESPYSNPIIRIGFNIGL